MPERICLRWGWLLILLLIGACSPAAAPAATPEPTSRFATVEGTVIRQTLPPSWTPSHTPTITPTPTATPVPSATPTPSADDICAGFDLIQDFSDQTVYTWESAIPIIASLNAPDTLVHLELAHRRTGTTAVYDFPGGQSIIVQFRLNALPSPGTYDWVLSVRHPVYGDLCQREGAFIVRRPLPTPQSTTEATAEVTEEPSRG